MDRLVISIGQAHEKQLQSQSDVLPQPEGHKSNAKWLHTEMCNETSNQCTVPSRKVDFDHDAELLQLVSIVTVC